MTLKTQFGDVEIDGKEIIIFPHGIYGFENIKKYVVIKTDPNSPFLLMQSVENENLAFILIDPRLFIAEYLLDISEEDLKIIDYSTDDEVIDYAIVTIPDNPEEMTANLQGPILINAKKHLGIQGISLNNSYTVKHKILSKKTEDS